MQTNKNKLTKRNGKADPFNVFLPKQRKNMRRLWLDTASLIGCILLHEAATSLQQCEAPFDEHGHLSDEGEDEVLSAFREGLDSQTIHACIDRDVINAACLFAHRRNKNWKPL